LKGGAENKNYLFKSFDTTFVARLYGKTHSAKGIRDASSIKNELKFMTEMQKGIYVPDVVKNRLGQYYVALQEDNFSFLVIMRFISGANPTTFDDNLIAKLADVLGKIFTMSSYFKVESMTEGLDIVSRAEERYQRYLLSTNHQDDQIASVIHKLYQEVKISSHAIPKLTKGYIHGDIKLQNMIVSDSGQLYLLDFDDYRYSYLLEDMVMTVMLNIDTKGLNLVRSGYLKKLIIEINQPKLIAEVESSLLMLLKARLIYSLIGLIDTNHSEKVLEIISDIYIKDQIIK